VALLKIRDEDQAQNKRHERLNALLRAKKFVAKQSENAPHLGLDFVRGMWGVSKKKIATNPAGDKFRMNAF